MVTTDRKKPDNPKTRSTDNRQKFERVRTKYNKDKDYSGRRNILGQEVSRVSNRSENDYRSGRQFNTITTTKTKSISPNRTAVEGPNRKHKMEVRTVKTKNLGKFLEKNPKYKVNEDRLVKKKTTTENVSHYLNKRVKAKPKEATIRSADGTIKKYVFYDPKTSYQKTNENKHSSGGAYYSDKGADVVRQRKTTREKVERGAVGKSRVNKFKNAIALVKKK